MGSQSVISREEAAYIAGFLDGDGSISAKVDDHWSTWSGYRIRIVVSFTQKTAHRGVLMALRLIIGCKRETTDYQSKGLSELVVSDRSGVKGLLGRIVEFLILKKPQAEKALRLITLLEKKRGKKNAIAKADFLRIAKLAQEIRELNSGTGSKDINRLSKIVIQI